jgi:hypothetical protein
MSNVDRRGFFIKQVYLNDSGLTIDGRKKCNNSHTTKQQLPCGDLHGCYDRPAYEYCIPLLSANFTLWYKSGTIHRDVGPAIIANIGLISIQAYYSHGVLDRVNGAAIEIVVDKNETNKSIELVYNDVNYDTHCKDVLRYCRPLVHETIRTSDCIRSIKVYATRGKITHKVIELFNGEVKEEDICRVTCEEKIQPEDIDFAAPQLSQFQIDVLAELRAVDPPPTIPSTTEEGLPYRFEATSLMNYWSDGCHLRCPTVCDTEDTLLRAKLDI